MRGSRKLAERLITTHEVQIAALTAAGQQFCDAIETRRSSTQVAFLRSIEPGLVQLYDALIAIPGAWDWYDNEDDFNEDDLLADVDPNSLSGEARRDENLEREIAALLGHLNAHQEVFDAYGDPTSVVEAWMSDHLSSIYGALRGYLPMIESGEPSAVREGLHELRFDFDHHLGEHITGALRAIYSLLHYNREFWDDDAWEAGIIKKRDES